MEDDLWECRKRAISALDTEAVEARVLLDDLFGVIDAAAEAMHNVDSPFGRVTALIIVKARSLAQACYSLALDGLAQEAGALFRPLLECLELLEYLRLDPARAQEALDGRLPSAGTVAKRIDGQFKDVRDYLNEHASHLSVSPESMRHLIRLADADKQVALQLQQPFDLTVLLKNLGSLFAVSAMVGIEAANCAAVAQCPMALTMTERIMQIRDRGFRLFKGRAGGGEA